MTPKELKQTKEYIENYGFDHFVSEYALDVFYKDQEARKLVEQYQEAREKLQDYLLNNGVKNLE